MLLTKYRRRRSILESYNKVIRVVKSCETKAHLDGAINMVNNFANTYGEPGHSWIHHKSTIYMDDLTHGLYVKLLRIHRDQKELIDEKRG